MATIVLAAAGAALGAGFGGTVLGLSGAVIGRAVGATLGRAVDQRILAGGSEPVEVGKIDRFNVMGASEGAPIPRCWGRTRLPGQVIWASPFRETSQKSGGKGMPSPKTVTYSYSVSLAIAICEGEILSIGRIWADGNEISSRSLNLRVYTGTEDQLPDPVIEAHLGEGQSPAYRGIAYVIIESLELSAFGNRVPQFSFEVMRRAQGSEANKIADFQSSIRAVALIPGTGEYSLATTKVRETVSFGSFKAHNVNGPSGDTDFIASINQLQTELPECRAISLVISWFGNDLRCNSCSVQPKVEQKVTQSASIEWRAGGVSRLEAEEVPRIDGRSIYGGTPADATVIEAIRALNERGQKVMFYPFILMDQLSDNKLYDPYTGQESQPALPWRGRITLSSAPGQAASPDTTEAAVEEVTTFFGNASAGDFSISDGRISYHGEPDWSYRRFILHYAHLCKEAGGVESFCIGSEMRGLTSIRGSGNTFPAVDALVQLAADVRNILGPDVKISYASDWSEYFGYHRDGNVYFHLDPLWSCEDVDFVGIDNYMPISDWRDTESHADSKWKSIYNIDYLKANIEGGEGFDWFYQDSDAAREQIRSLIKDDSHGEDWIFRFKDIRSWWSNFHYDRINGERQETPTGWAPSSKPIRFTEFGCAAIDMGTNEPNKFLDIRSSESSIPRASSGTRDDLVQMQYFKATVGHWLDPSHNPVSGIYGAPMVDLDFCYAWAWDARPYPDFPRNVNAWSDGDSYYRGHWLNGRSTSVPLSRLVTEICQSAGIVNIDTKYLYGSVVGYNVSSNETARSIIQSLSILFSFDCIERSGTLVFRGKGLSGSINIDARQIVLNNSGSSSFEVTRSQPFEIASGLRLTYLEADGDFSVKVVEAVSNSQDSGDVIDVEFAAVIPSGVARSIARTILEESLHAKEGFSAELPLSFSRCSAGAFVQVKGQSYRIDRCDASSTLSVKGGAFEPSIYNLKSSDVEIGSWAPYLYSGPVERVWLDLPLVSSKQNPFSPFLALLAIPWGRSVVLLMSNQDSNYELNSTFRKSSNIGVTLSELRPNVSGLVDRFSTLTIQMYCGELASASPSTFLMGENLLAIGDPTKGTWEVLQFLDCTLISPGVFKISGLLRGQFGTEVDDGIAWSAGSRVILLDEALSQISFESDDLNREKHFRVGFQNSEIFSDEMIHDVRSFKGIGLRPFSVSHFRFSQDQSGQHNFVWKRRTRLGGDSWEGVDVPLGEESEQYLFSVLSLAGALLFRAVVSNPYLAISREERLARGFANSYFSEVSQLSVAFGAGRSRRILVIS